MNGAQIDPPHPPQKTTLKKSSLNKAKTKCCNKRNEISNLIGIFQAYISLVVKNESEIKFISYK